MSTVGYITVGYVSKKEEESEVLGLTADVTLVVHKGLIDSVAYSNDITNEWSR